MDRIRRTAKAKTRFVPQKRDAMISAISMFIAGIAAGAIGYVIEETVCFVIARVIDVIKRNDWQKIENTIEQINNDLAEVIEQMETTK